MPDRRHFLASVASIALGSQLVSCTNNSEEETVAMQQPQDVTQNFGVGLFTIPHLLQEDFPGTIKMLAEIGYREIEMFGPYSFSVQQAHDYWNPIGEQLGITKTGFFGHTPQEVRQILDDNRMTSPSMHVDLVTLEEKPEAVAEAMNIVGQQYAGIAAIPEELRQNLDGYKQTADRFNAIGERLSEYGFKFLYHNHGYGLVEMEGEIPFNTVIERTDPQYVALEMDVYWTVAGRADPIAYLESYPGRFKLMHVKDMLELSHFEGDGGDPQQWMALFPKMADAGSGVLGLEKIIPAAMKSGVDHFYLEKDLTITPNETLTNSFNFMSSIDIV